jgi:transcriptional regulator of arginine metabolism
MVANQDELRRKLRRHGLSRHPGHALARHSRAGAFQGAGGYSLAERQGASQEDEDDAPPTLAEMIEGFGLRARQAMNQVVVRTVIGGAQPLGAALDREGWSEVVGTLAGDDTVLVICPDVRRAGEVESD